MQASRATVVPLIALLPLAVLLASCGPSRTSNGAASACPWVSSGAPIPQRVEEVMAHISEAQELELVDGTQGSYVGNLPPLQAAALRLNPPSASSSRLVAERASRHRANVPVLCSSES